MKKIESVTIIVPCRNEGKCISKCMASVAAQTYPKEKLEVLVIDGMSEDGTRSIVSDYCSRYPFIRMIDNPHQKTPFALNIGIREARGEVLVRMDAHAEYPSEFISKALALLERTGADVVGGPIQTLPGAPTIIAKSIALATSHPFGVGNSKFRTSQKEGYVDTVPFGAYRKEIFEKVGIFNEKLLRNQDNELHSRIMKAGGRIYLSPELTAQYYNQATIEGLARQAFKTGMWNVFTWKTNRAAFRWRHFVPFVFVSGIMASLTCALLLPGCGAVIFLISGSYAAAVLYSSIRVSFKSGLIYAFILPGIFLLYHVCYGLGTWAGLWKTVIPAQGSDI